MRIIVNVLIFVCFFFFFRFNKITTTRVNVWWSNWERCCVSDLVYVTTWYIITVYIFTNYILYDYNLRDNYDDIHITTKWRLIIIIIQINCIMHNMTWYYFLYFFYDSVVSHRRDWGEGGDKNIIEHVNDLISRLVHRRCRCNIPLVSIKSLYTYIVYIISMCIDIYIGTFSLRGNNYYYYHRFTPTGVTTPISSRRRLCVRSSDERVYNIILKSIYLILLYTTSDRSPPTTTLSST